MPELPDVVVYIRALQKLLAKHVLTKAIVKSPFVLRTFDPPLEDANGLTIERFSRIGKRIVWQLSDECGQGQINLVFHLMIAGRYHWKKPGKLPTGKNDLIAFQFDHGTMMLTESSTKKRASLHVVAASQSLAPFDRGGIEVLDCSLKDFSEVLTRENRTLKRALTNPLNYSGIGNAYSDEILLVAGLSPTQRTHNLKPTEIERLFEAVVSTMNLWIDRLSDSTGDKFPEKVTAFRPEMMAHGKFGKLCPQCNETKIQRISFTENEWNYCPRCQTGGKLLADRSLSRLLKDDWPKTIEELEGQDIDLS